MRESNKVQHEISKSQAIRLIDIFFIGPYLGWIAWRSKNLTVIERRILQGLAVSTIVYNARNYELNRRILNGQETTPTAQAEGPAESQVRQGMGPTE